MRQEITSSEDRSKQDHAKPVGEKRNPSVVIILVLLLIGLVIVAYLNLRPEPGEDAEVQEILKQIDENPPQIPPVPQGEPLPAFGGRR